MNFMKIDSQGGRRIKVKVTLEINLEYFEGNI